MYFGLNLSLGGVGSYIGAGVEDIALILYTDDINNFVYGTDGSGNAILTNQGSGSSTHDGLLNTGRGIELGAGNDLAFTVGSNWITWFDFADGQFHKQTGNKTFNTITINNILISASEPSDADILILNANSQLMAKLAMSGTGSIDELDLTLIGSDEWYACSEPSLATIYDARGSNTETITNYAETIRTNADFQTKGLQTTCLDLDGNGEPTAYDETQLHFYGNGWIDTQWIPDSRFVVDIGQYFTDERTQEYSGYGLDISIGKTGSNDIYYVFSGENYNADASLDLDQYNFLAMEFDGIDGLEYDFNGVLKATDVVGSLSYPAEDFRIGMAHENYGDRSLINSINHFRVLTGSLAENYDALEAYNEWNS